MQNTTKDMESKVIEMKNTTLPFSKKFRIQLQFLFLGFLRKDFNHSKMESFPRIEDIFNGGLSGEGRKKKEMELKRRSKIDKIGRAHV